MRDRKNAICKELTKLYEYAFRTTIRNAMEYYNNNEPKGEFVLVIEGKNFKDIEQEKVLKWEEISIYDHYKQYVDKGIDSKEAMKIVAKERNISKRDVYAAVLESK